jgi:peptide/nickel transport system ATP-binding protein
VLEIRNLKVDYGPDRVLNGIDLDLQRGQSLALVGESGTGKTTLGRTLMGLGEGAAGGQILFQGTDLLRLDAESLRKIRWNRIAMVFQNVTNALNPVYPLVEQVMEPMVEHGLRGRREARRRAEELLQEVDLPPNRFSFFPHQISGGEQQRTLLAMALANDPCLLILDEPLAAVDEKTRNLIHRFLRKLNRERKITLLVFTHDIGTAVLLSDRFGTLYGGRIMELGSTGKVVQQPQHPYTRALIRSYPNMTSDKDLQGIKGRMARPVLGCPFHPRCTQALEVCRRKTPPLRDRGGRQLACHRGGIIPVIRVVGLTKDFDGFRAVDSVNFSLYGGETLALIGPSGSGKTTLARMLMGFQEPTRGKVFLEADGKKADGPLNRKVQMIFQNPGESLSHRMKVLDLVKEPLDIAGILPLPERRQRVLRLLEEVQLPSHTAFTEKYPHQLSGGEIQRVAIARALALDPDVLIADEPTSALDPSIQAKVLKLLLQLQENRGLSVFFITHDISVARKVSDRIAVMVEGRIVEEGSAYQVTGHPQHPFTKAILAAAPSFHEAERSEWKDLPSLQTAS